MPILQVRLDDKDHARMKEIADTAGISASEVVRHWINESPLKASAGAVEAEQLREEVTRLKRTLASWTNPTPSKVEIHEPLIYDADPNGPFTRFGTSRAAPKPSSKR